MKDGALLLLAVVALALLTPDLEAHWIYNRPVSDVAWALSKSRPDVSLKTRKVWAKTIIEEGSERKFDSFTVVSMCHHETGWHTGLVGGKGGRCVGACQHCMFKYRKCRDDDSDPWCQKKKQKLLDPIYNIRETARDITQWRKYCRKKTGHGALFYRWLHGFQGFGRPSQGLICGMKETRRGWRDVPKPKLVRNVISYRRKLIKLNQRRK